MSAVQPDPNATRVENECRIKTGFEGSLSDLSWKFRFPEMNYEMALGQGDVAKAAGSAKLIAERVKQYPSDARYYFCTRGYGDGNSRTAYYAREGEKFDSLPRMAPRPEEHPGHQTCLADPIISGMMHCTED